MLLSGFILTIALIGPTGAKATEPTRSAAPEQTIHVVADKLVIDMGANRAVFSGHAKAVQGQTTVLADELTITYKDAGGNAGAAQNDLDTNSIEKIIAQGHVRIEMEDRIIVGDKAESFNDERKIVISGPGTRIISGKDEVSGEMITYHQDEDRVEIAGRVKALIHTNERGLN
jgi:lipopolysaccharide export system protein LptA